MPQLNYHHLRYFRAVAVAGSLNEAARTLNVSASSLSVQLKALEGQLGQPLFARTGRNLTLTEAGRIALAYADTVFQSGEALINTLHGRGAENRPRLAVGSAATLSRNFQLELLSPLIRRSDVELSITAGPLPDLLAQLTLQTLDLVLSNQPAARDDDPLLRNTLAATQAVIIVSRADSSIQSLNFPHDLARLPIVLPGRASGIRAGFQQLMDAAGIAPRIHAEVDDMAMLRLVARETDAVTLTPRVVIAGELNSGILVERCIVPNLEEAFYIITRERRFPNPLVAPLLAGAAAP